MKKTVLTMLLIAALLLPGCAANALERDLNAAGASAENVLRSSADPVTQPTTADTKLTREEAQAIALEHAGFTADQVTNLRTVFEIDDGVPQYEVEFHQGRWEYDYEINATTGEIMSMDQDD